MGGRISRCAETSSWRLWCLIAGKLKRASKYPARPFTFSGKGERWDIIRLNTSAVNMVVK